MKFVWKMWKQFEKYEKIDSPRTYIAFIIAAPLGLIKASFYTGLIPDDLKIATVILIILFKAGQKTPLETINRLDFILIFYNRGSIGNGNEDKSD